MTRNEVFAVISDERDYQDVQTKSPERPDMNPDLSLGDYILAIEHNIALARMAWYNGSGNHFPAKDYIRKATALSVACFEKYGVPARDWSNVTIVN